MATPFGNKGYQTDSYENWITGLVHLHMAIQPIKKEVIDMMVKFLKHEELEALYASVKIFVDPSMEVSKISKAIIGLRSFGLPTLVITEVGSYIVMA